MPAWSRYVTEFTLSQAEGLLLDQRLGTTKRPCLPPYRQNHPKELGYRGFTSGDYVMPHFRTQDSAGLHQVAGGISVIPQSGVTAGRG